MTKEILFWKYQGAGNDFIMLDQRKNIFIQKSDTALIAALCDRHFGIGADGLILLLERPGYDFEMVYFNSDGRESTMCGNGGRCITAFAADLGIQRETYFFRAIDGDHKARIRGEWIELQMNNVTQVRRDGAAFVLNTGSPHYVLFVDQMDQLDVPTEGRKVRNNETYIKEGINVNFVSAHQKGLQIRTYERGVEGETLACGTGITAAAVAKACQMNQLPGNIEYQVEALGGNLAVRLHVDVNGTFSDIWLCGPAQQVFRGTFPSAEKGS